MGGSWSESITMRRSIVILLSAWLVLGADADCSTNGTMSCGRFLDHCSVQQDCGQGLYCASCSGAADGLRRCHRGQTFPPYDQNGTLPFNKYAFLATHNSFAYQGAPELTGVRLTPINQEESVADQLQHGVRGLMLDVYDFREDIWLCHSFGGVCYDLTAFEPLNGTLATVEAFLTANPGEIITIFLEDYVTTANGLKNVFTSAGLMKYWFPLESMPTDGKDWPTVNQMLAKNWRLLVFTSNSSKEASEGIAHQWSYVLENKYGDDGMVAGECSNRAESAALNDSSRTLILQNYFPTNPSPDSACQQNSASLQQMLPVCHSAAAQRWSNFLAVDSYRESTGGGAFDAVDNLNNQIRM